MTPKKRKRRSPKGPGWTIPQFARLPEVDVSPTVIRTAVENQLIKAIDWNGIKRIPPSERDRYVAMWGQAAE